MILTLMYHKVGSGKYANPIEIFEKQFPYLKSNANVVIPGDPLTGGLNVSLTFDDATIDFYEQLYPLLHEYQLKAVLAIPVGMIEKENHCSWSQLCEMERSGLITFASHSFSHCNLLRPHTDLRKEIVQSKRVIEDRLQTPISNFVYPYGKWNRSLQELTLKHYTCAMRIGSALNRKWDPLLYRIPADNLSHPLAPFSKWKKWEYGFNYYCNKLRGK